MKYLQVIIDLRRQSSHLFEVEPADILQDPRTERTPTFTLSIKKRSIIAIYCTGSVGIRSKYQFLMESINQPQLLPTITIVLLVLLLLLIYKGGVFFFPAFRLTATFEGIVVWFVSWWSTISKYWMRNFRVLSQQSSDWERWSGIFVGEEI